MKRVHQFLRSDFGAQTIEWLMAVKTLPLLGTQHYCPCCGWHIRTFTHGNSSFRARKTGYCPRCNSKPRHRWLWLDMSSRTNITTEKLKLLHISPSYSIARRLRKYRNIDYFSCDLHYRPFVQFKMDLTQSALASESFDMILCIHVLEHVERDRPAISELYRLLKPGGLAIVAVPVRMNQKTHEDPSIVDPEDRLREFGERDHMRYYGNDIVDRLENVGFTVETVFAKDLDEEIISKYGLKSEEVMFYCRRS